MAERETRRLSRKARTQLDLCALLLLQEATNENEKIQRARLSTEHVVYNTQQEDDYEYQETTDRP